MYNQDVKPLASQSFSFKEKLSFVTNSDIYKNLPYKLWTICKLIVSFGQCKLSTITPKSCNSMVYDKKTSQCIFSRKVEKLIKEKFHHAIQGTVIKEQPSHFLRPAPYQTTEKSSDTTPAHKEQKIDSLTQEILQEFCPYSNNQKLADDKNSTETKDQENENS